MRVSKRAAAILLAIVPSALLAGCGSSSSETAAPDFPHEGTKLVVAGIAEAPADESRARTPNPQSSPGIKSLLASIAAQAGEWSARQKAEVSSREEPFQPAEASGQSDVIVFSGDRMGDLVAAGLLDPIADEEIRPRAPSVLEDEPPAATLKTEDTLAFGDVLPAFRDQVTLYGEDRRMALPLGGSALVLVYRVDAFERKENQAEAAKAHLKLEPPETWEELDDLAAFFQGRDWDGDGSPESGAAIAFAADAEGIGADILIQRAAALGLHPDHFGFLFDDDTLEPRIATPPFIEATRGLVSWTSNGPPGVVSFDSSAARAAFRDGHVALLIDRAERASTWTDPKRPVTAGVAALPGSNRVFDPDRKEWSPATSINRPTVLCSGGGWLAGLPKGLSGPKRAAAIDFLRDLAGPETSSRLLGDRLFPMLPTRSAQLAAGMPDPRGAPGVVPRLWSKAVTDALTASRVIPGLRLPEAAEYHHDLGVALASAASGESAEAALQKASESWASRTERLGHDRQLWHYRNCLNLRTSDEPPPVKTQ